MRSLRILQECARYHVVARTNNKLMILESRGMKELFQMVIRRAKMRYSFRIENFCLMNNHFHMIIQPEKGQNLSRIMQWILSRFAAACNKINGSTGHVWGARFYSRILQGLRDFMNTFTYIDENPVKAGVARMASSWEYGGLRQSREGNHTIVDRLPPWILVLFPAHRPAFSIT